jgi:hypothetical protein
MPEVFGHKPSRYSFEERNARERAFDKTAEPVRSTALISEVDWLIEWLPPAVNVWEVPTVSCVLQTDVTDTDVWEQPDTRPCFHYVGGQSIWVQLEYSGHVVRATGGTLGVGNFLIYTIALNVGLGVPTPGEEIGAEQQHLSWVHQSDMYSYNFVWHGLIVPDTYIAPIFFQWLFRRDWIYMDMNFSILATRSEHG